MDGVLKKAVRNFPRAAGVYSFIDKQGKIIYIGKAVNLSQRLKTYLSKILDQKTRKMVSQVANIDCLKVFSEFEGLLLEAVLIKKYQPKYNVRLKDDKSFLYIAVTKEEFPKVLATRKNDLTNPKYLFGPFPSAKTVRQVLAFLRRIFPYCSQKKNVRPCFWSHLGLCSPCPGEIAKLTGKEKKIQRKLYSKKSSAYLNNIKNLIIVLSGKSKNLIAKLTLQMEEAAKQEDFEKAAYLRDQIEKLSWLTKPRFSISSYLESANFFEEEQKKELDDLSQILGLTSLRRIECVDVSNIGGLFATGSIVVFLDGIASKDDYRRFKIKISGKSDDVAMISEILKRRLGHKEWDYPDLIIIDGGKPQVSGALNVLEQWNIKIPIIGLAKKFEEIVVKMEERAGARSFGIERWKMEKLPEGSPALNLLKRIRDESHRFALAYHRYLRNLSLT